MGRIFFASKKKRKRRVLGRGARTILGGGFVPATGEERKGIFRKELTPEREENNCQVLEREKKSRREGRPDG